MYSYGPPHMAGQKLDDQLEHTFSSYVRIWDITLKTYQKRWTIGRSGERGSGISMLAARHDIYIYIYIYIGVIPLSYPLSIYHYIYVCVCVCVCGGVIVIGNRNGDTRSKPVWGFQIALILLKKLWIQLFSFQRWINSLVNWVFSLG